MSALDEPGRGWGSCVHLPDPCTTLAPQAIEEVGALAAAIEVVEGARKNAIELAAEERFEVDVDVNGKRPIVRGVRSRK